MHLLVGFSNPDHSGFFLFISQNILILMLQKHTTPRALTFQTFTFKNISSNNENATSCVV
ncbi:hypothetical protein HanIR_Chr06g0291471 [Helianthus annuus]|nr:hypothetical protein HanIR_Chr06g0291471 [Helianthus annuus]